MVTKYIVTNYSELEILVNICNSITTSNPNQADVKVLIVRGDALSVLPWQVVFKNIVLKVLFTVNEPYYSNVESSILNLNEVEIYDSYEDFTDNYPSHNFDFDISF